jgi:multiple sugar transport system permease protein
VQTLTILAFREANELRYGPAAAYATLLFVYVAITAYMFVRLLGADLLGEVQQSTKLTRRGRRQLAKGASA